MTTPLDENDRLYDGITNHRSNFENVYKKFSVAHSVETGKHEFLKFKDNAETVSPSIPNVKLFYTSKKSGTMQLVDGTGKAKELVILDKALIAYSRVGDLVLKNLVWLRVANGGKSANYGFVGPGVSKTKYNVVRDGKNGDFRMVYDSQRAPGEKKWWIQILPLTADFIQMADSFTVSSSPGQIAVQLNVQESKTQNNFYWLLFLNWVVYGE